MPLQFDRNLLKNLLSVHNLAQSMQTEIMKKYLFLEAFYGGSHKQLLDTILEYINSSEYDLFTLPAKKWHWKARMSALHFTQMIPDDHCYQVLFTSSVLNLAELIGMRYDLGKCKKIIYFHENQLVYPIQEIKERDCQYGLNQIMSCLAADHIIFNSKFNQNSFLDQMQTFLNISSDRKLHGIREKIEPKCSVIYFPINFEKIPKREPKINADTGPLHLVWPHRWEHDKNYQLLADVLIEMHNRNVDYRVSIIGENFTTNPKCFDQLKDIIESKIINFGYLSKEDYFKCILNADVVISTANHEFFGVSMLEATHCGCVPLAPNKLVYPEIYPKSNLYNTKNQLQKLLINWCRNYNVFEKKRKLFFEQFSFEKFSTKNLIDLYMKKIL